MTTQMFKAKNMKSAIGMVNEQFGDDAIILSTKKSNGFVEIEASDNDAVIKSFPRRDEQKFSNIFLKRVSEKNDFSNINKKEKIKEKNSFHENNKSQFKDSFDELKSEIKKLKHEINNMYLTNESSLCNDLSYSTPIKLSQQKFSNELIRKLNYTFIGKNFEEGKIAFYREISKKLACSDFSRVLKSKNIFIFGQSGSGKSTLAAKIATYLSDNTDQKKINFIDVSNNSTNHSEVLRGYSRVLGIPIVELKNYNILANKNNVNNNINIFDFCGDLNFSMQKVFEIKKNFTDFDFCSILALQSGCNSTMIENILKKVHELKPMIAITKLDECWVGAEELSTLYLNNARIGIVTGTKVLIDSILQANENSLTKYMKENF